MPSLVTYKLIKPSALVFRTARQRDRVLRDWRRLTRMTECGPELLAMRRSHGGKLSGVAKALFVLIRSGGERLTALNVDRLWRPKAVGLLHGDEIRERRSQARGAFETRLAAASAAVPLTGLVVDRRSLAALRAAADAVR